ncbi:MAG: hypothetical protein ABIS86_14235 [Streptosporangiaceae bacterium]
MQPHLYLEDTYLFEVKTTVAESGDGERGPWLRLADNIFHPQGGGQPSDVGTVDGLPVQPFRDQGAGEHTVLLSADRALDTGLATTARIDPQVRRRHAALHTCGHVVDGFVRALGFEHVVSNHFPGQARIEFKVGDVRPDLEKLAASVEAQTNSAIAANRKVSAEQRDGQRFVLVDGLGEDPCGGTHVAGLAQLTGFSLRSVKIKSGTLKIGYTVEHTD